jgi:multidrug efflux pump subunit AcrA (membrane-fusion protein)
MQKLVALTLIIAAVSCSGGANKKLVLEQPQLRTLQKRITVSGQIRPRRSTYLFPLYNSYVRKIFVDIGKNVKRGDSLVSLSQTLQETESGIFPLKSPFDGTVVQLFREEGEFVQAGSGEENRILRIDDLSQLTVNAEVPEVDIPLVKIGQTVMLKAAALPQFEFKGLVQSISQAATESSRGGSNNERSQFSVQVKVVDKSEQLMPGMSVLGDIVVAEKEKALSLRQEYVFKTEDGRYSVTLKSGEKKKIDIGFQNDEFIEVQGLSAQDEVRMVDLESLGSHM